MTRGRPRKVRPRRGAAVRPGMSHRDIAAAVGMSRQQIAQAITLAAIPDEEFEEMVEAEKPATIPELVAAGRRILGRSTGQKRERRCPHCGGIT